MAFGLAVIAVVSSAVLLGAAQSESDVPAGSVTTAAVENVPATQQLLLANLRRGFAQPAFVKVRAGPPPRGARNPAWKAPSTWLFVGLPRRGVFEEARGHWQASILSGVFGYESQRRRLPRLRGLSDYIALPGGRQKPSSASSIVLRPGPKSKTTAELLRARAAQGAASANVELVRVRVNTPLGWPAPEVIVRTADPAKFVAQRSENIFRILNPVTQADDRSILSEGAFLRVVDQAGRLVDAAGFSVRTGKGVGL